MSMNRLLCSAVVAALLAPAVFLVDADASEPSAKELMHARHEHYEELGDAFKVVRDQSKASKPDMAAIKTAAKFVGEAAAEQAEVVPGRHRPGSRQDAGARCNLGQARGIQSRDEKIQRRGAEVDSAANAGDADAVKTAFGDVGKACKGCHEQFREKEQD